MIIVKEHRFKFLIFNRDTGSYFQILSFKNIKMKLFNQDDSVIGTQTLFWKSPCT